MAANASYKTTCRLCCRRKRKCITRPGNDKCDLCISVGEECVFDISRQGSRTDIRGNSEAAVASMPLPPVGLEQSALGDGISVGLEQSAPGDASCKSPQLINNKRKLKSWLFDNTNNNTNNNAQGTPVAPVIICEGNCIGKRLVFSNRGGTNELDCMEISNRAIPNPNFDGCVWMQCTQFDGDAVKDCCRGAVIAYKPKRGKSSPWYLAVISLLKASTLPSPTTEFDSDGIIYLNKWIGPTTVVDGIHVPAFFEMAHSELLGKKGRFSKHLRMEQYNINKGDGFKICFLNQVYGQAPYPNNHYSRGIINEHDNCIQSSPYGGDVYPITLPRIKCNNRIKPPFVEVTSATTGQSDIVSTRNSTRKRDRATYTNDLDDPLVKSWCSPPTKVIKDGTLCTVAVIYDLEGNPIGRPLSELLETKYKGCFFVPSITDALERAVVQHVYPIKVGRLNELKKYNETGGVALAEAEKFIADISVAKIATVCINDAKVFDKYQNYNKLSKVFSGTAIPTLSAISSTNNLDELGLLELGITVTYGIVASEEVRQYPAISTSLVDSSFHAGQITDGHVQLMNKAFSPSGSYPDRDCCQSVGHCTFYGPKQVNTRSRPSPSEGPHNNGSFLLYRDKINPLFAPSAYAIINELATKTYWAYVMLDKPYRILRGLSPSDKIGHNRIMLFTIDFGNELHLDYFDKLLRAILDRLLNDCKQILRSQVLRTEVDREMLLNFEDYINHYGSSVPTTCSYQFVRTSQGLLHPHIKVTVLQVFASIGLGISHRICDYWSHNFSAYDFAHCTCIPTFICDGKVFFGKCPYVSVVAWGGGGDSEEEKKRKAEEKARKIANKERDDRQRKRARNNGRGRSDSRGGGNTSSSQVPTVLGSSGRRGRQANVNNNETEVLPVDWNNWWSEQVSRYSITNEWTDCLNNAVRQLSGRRTYDINSVHEQRGYVEISDRLTNDRPTGLTAVELAAHLHKQMLSINPNIETDRGIFYHRQQLFLSTFKMAARDPDLDNDFRNRFTPEYVTLDRILGGGRSVSEAIANLER